MTVSNQIKTALGLFLLAAFLMPTPAKAQLEELQQTVFGMDCAPCAYSLQKRIQDIEGVQSITVSLNDGLALVRFEPNNRVTLETVRTAVTDVGFSPENAAVRINGTLSEEGDRWFLIPSADERFLLPNPPQGALSGEELRFTGQINKEKDSATETWVLHR